VRPRVVAGRGSGCAHRSLRPTDEYRDVTAADEQLDEARQRGWLGEINRLEHILAAVDDKLEEIHRATRRLSVVELTVPRVGGATLST
jgi:hypothetical protein